MNEKLEKISQMLTSGDKGLVKLGIIALGTSFSKSEIQKSLVPLSEIAPPEDANKFHIAFAKTYAPFGLIGSGFFYLPVNFQDFALYMGFGPYIIYSDTLVEIEC